MQAENLDDTNWSVFSGWCREGVGVTRVHATSSTSDVSRCSVEINEALACVFEGEQVVYFNGHLPVFMALPRATWPVFRLFTSQLIVQGSATQGHISKAFGCPW